MCKVIGLTPVIRFSLFSKYMGDTKYLPSSIMISVGRHQENVRKGCGFEFYRYNLKVKRVYLKK